MNKNNLIKVDGDLELVTVVESTKRYRRNKPLVQVQKESIEHLIKTIDETPKTPNNAIILDSYAKTLTTLKNKIDKQRKELRALLNQEGDEVHKFYNTTFVKPLEDKIKELKECVLELTTPIEVEFTNEGTTQNYTLPKHLIEVECEAMELAKILTFIQGLNIKYEVK